MTLRGLPHRLAGFFEVLRTGFSRYPENIAELRSLTVQSMHLPEDERHPEYSLEWQTGVKWLASAIDALVDHLSTVSDSDASGIRRGNLKHIALSPCLITPGGSASSSSLIDPVPLSCLNQYRVQSMNSKLM